MKRFSTLFIFMMAVIAIAIAGNKMPRYIFYFIGDGMGMGPVMAAQNYNRMVLGNESPLLMMQFPTVAWCQTYSASSSTTDSAAAGTALSTGHKTRNGMLGMDADSIPVMSIAADLHAAGWGVGLVTTVAADDATPAAFYAHVPNRHLSYEIDLAAAKSGYKFIGGAGLKGLDSDRHDDVKAAFDDEGVQIVIGPDGLGKISSDRVVALNVERGRNWNVGYATDGAQGNLTLPMLTEACLSHLEKVSPKRFFMMVEGGNIDHALHANDAGTAIGEILAFDESLRIAYDFYLSHPDETLIVVTADHDTGGLAMGNNTVGYSSSFGNVKFQHRSKEVMSERLKQMLKDENIPTWEEMKKLLSEELGLFSNIDVSEERERDLHEKFVSTFELRNSADQKTLYANFDAFAVAVYQLFSDLAGYGFTSTAHTGNPVPLFAIGVGADNFHGFNNNVDIAPIMRKLTLK